MLEIIATIFVVVSLGLHVLSSFLVAFRLNINRNYTVVYRPPVSILIPLCGIEPYSHTNLWKIVNLDYDDYEVIFCVANPDDPIIPMISSFVKDELNMRLLIGNDEISNNPKLNNLYKGWNAAKYDWIIMADSNVWMPSDYIQQMLDRCRYNTGLVCSPPIGALPIGMAANIEASFLNTYQARWQYIAEIFNMGFAQGKSMLWNHRILEDAGGLVALATDIAEDSAATKLIKKLKLKVHLVDKPFKQLLGRRKFKDVWQRQLRWARMRRKTFPLHYTLEIFTSSIPTLIASIIAAPMFGIDVFSSLFTATMCWYMSEFLLMFSVDWDNNRYTPLSLIVRDCLLPVIWVCGWFGSSIIWKGKELPMK